MLMVGPVCIEAAGSFYLDVFVLSEVVGSISCI